MMRSPRFWDRDVDPKSREAASLTRILLTPLAAIYAGMTKRRIAQADPHTLTIPVICVGNISVGGTGKTPVAAALRDRLSAQLPGARIATLSRGYGGSSKGPLKVDFTVHTAGDVGDEALMFSCSGEAWIGADRALAGQAMEQDGVDLIIMDDGHQNPGLHKDLSLIVVDRQSVFGNGHVIPKGPLREPVAVGLSRADAIVLTGSGDMPEELDACPLPIIQSHLVPRSANLPRTYVAFAGIGRPEKFFSTLEQCGASIAETVPFPDHHVYTDSDITYLKALAEKREATLITTEKDFVRLRASQRTGILAFPVRAEFENDDVLDHLLEPLVQRARQAK
ncbi:tetraacyldisaccharide 4'-kinase [Henriciella pelagia]|jgi:tetraacyldisaccharide 4'-kinase|uniref:Tetraacyldisaccharide 4'-kinase n=1 Tax=Henriciella pelagia TaxID=1977912 RepID=A0ABQ1J741_9PROT|nr:tetraacyldisaccharide 4'-kinase [Henriciella pelagia]GGB60312.1 tetraacyldisaccharide 4'-kinase [Henriciella pelagia]